MATREEVFTAIRNADKAGDSAAVRKLGAYLQTMPEPSDTPPADTPPADPMASHRARLAQAEQELADATANPTGRKALIAGQTIGELPVAIPDMALSLGTKAIAVPAAGVAGAVAAPFVGNDKAVDIVNKVSSFAHEPATEIAKGASRILAKPGEKLAEGGDKAGQVVTDVTGSPAAGALANGAIQTLPALISPEVRGAFKSVGGAAAGAARGAAAKVGVGTPPAAAAPAAATLSPQSVAAAQNYAARNLGLDWDSLSAAFKSKLAGIVENAGDLSNLDPAALKREAQLASLPVPVPATRGQLTRNPGQMRREANLAATDEGAPIAETFEAGNQALVQNLDVLKGKVSGRGKTAATATNESDVGRSVQDAALGAKQAKAKAATNEAYETARNSPEAQMPVDPEPLRQFLQDPINAKDSSPLMGLLRGFVPEEGGGITVGNLERIRQKLQAGTQSADGTAAHTAGEAVKVIDQMMEGAGGDLYAKARAAHRAERSEFKNQSAVAKLVGEKSGTTDRRVALENTTKAITSGSVEDIQNVKRSLLTGGDAETRTAGKAAWRDVRAQVIQQIKDEATGGVATTAKDGLNLQPGALKRAIDRIGPERLDEIFGAGTHRQLMDVLDASVTLKTMPALGGPPVGSTTMQNVLSFLSKGLDKIPVIGDTASGAVKAVQKLRDLGAGAREAKAATTTPLSEAVAKAAGNAKKTDRLRKARGALPVVPLSQLPSQPNQ